MFRTIKRFFYATFHPSMEGLPGIVLMATAVTAAFALWASSLVAGALAVALGATFVWLGRMAMDSLDSMEASKVEAAAVRWAYQGADEDEVRSRMSQVASLGAAAVVGAHAVNIDGMPMVPGTGVDIYGRAFGDVHNKPYDFETGAQDMSTGLELDPSMAYEPPMGMDMGSSTDYTSSNSHSF